MNHILHNKIMGGIRKKLEDSSATVGQLSYFIKSNHVSDRQEDDKQAVVNFLNSKTPEDRLSFITSEDRTGYTPIYWALDGIADDKCDMAEAIFSCLDEEQKFESLCMNHSFDEEDFRGTNFLSLVLDDYRDVKDDNSALKFVVENIEEETLFKLLREVPGNVGSLCLSNNVLEELIVANQNESVDMILSRVKPNNLNEVLGNRLDSNNETGVWNNLVNYQAVGHDISDTLNTIYRHLGRSIAYATKEESNDPVIIKTFSDEGYIDIEHKIIPSELDLDSKYPFEDKFGQEKAPFALVKGFVDAINEINTINMIKDLSKSESFVKMIKKESRHSSEEMDGILEKISRISISR